MRSCGEGVAPPNDAFRSVYIEIIKLFFSCSSIKYLLIYYMTSLRPILRPSLSFSPSNPPGALVPGQRPDRALNSAQFAAARQARAAGVATGLSGRALEVSVAQAVMRVP